MRYRPSAGSAQGSAVCAVSSAARAGGQGQAALHSWQIQAGRCTWCRLVGWLGSTVGASIDRKRRGRLPGPVGGVGVAGWPLVAGRSTPAAWTTSAAWRRVRQCRAGHREPGRRWSAGAGRRVRSPARTAQSRDVSTPSSRLSTVDNRRLLGADHVRSRNGGRDSDAVRRPGFGARQ